MGLVLGANTSDQVSCGSASVLDNLTTWTALLWLFCTTRTTNRALFSKASGGVGIGVVHTDTSGNLRLTVSRVSTNFQQSTTGGPIAANTWICFAVTFDRGGPTAGFYKGTLSANMAAVSTSAATNGSGSFSSDASGNLVWGNDTSTTASFRGTFGYAAHFNRVLSLAEMISWQWDPSVLTSGCVNFMWFGLNGTGTQPDLSGKLGNGTVTGATEARHCPILPGFARRDAYATIGRAAPVASPIVIPRFTYLPEIL